MLPRLPVDDTTSTAHVIDGMAVVQMMKNAGSATFGELANNYFQLITAHLGNNGCNRVDVVFYHYDKEDSIKESERARRGSSSSFEVQISGLSILVPEKSQNFNSNPVNKTNLKAFLGSTGKEMAKTSLAGDQKLVLAGCFIHSDDTFAVTQNQETPLLHLSSDHEEADTRMLLHASDCSRDHQRIVVQSPDTYVAALRVYAFSMINAQQLWFRTGVKDKPCFLPAHRLAEKLGEDLCCLIPSFHALTGCDSTSALYQFGKRKAWKAL